MEEPILVRQLRRAPIDSIVVFKTKDSNFSNTCRIRAWLNRRKESNFLQQTESMRDSAKAFLIYCIYPRSMIQSPSSSASSLSFDCCRWLLAMRRATCIFMRMTQYQRLRYCTGAIWTKNSATATNQRQFCVAVISSYE
jgi:hypothetical protein